MKYESLNGTHVADIDVVDGNEPVRVVKTFEISGYVAIVPLNDVPLIGIGVIRTSCVVHDQVTKSRRTVTRSV